MTAGSSLLEVKDLVVHYAVRRGLREAIRGEPRRGLRAVDGVSFVVSKGEMLALVGESGCGKTSTAQAMLGLIESAQGSVIFDGQDLLTLTEKELKSVRRRIQMIYQDPYESLDPRYRVGDTVEEPLVIHRKRAFSAAQRRERVLDALEQVGLSPGDSYIRRFPHELSGGQRQRVAIAASLVLDPQLLIADEPVSMLDVSVRAGVLAVLNELRRSGLGVVMITHDLSTAAHYADRIAVMYLGRVVEIGSARAVIEGPQHPYTQALLSVAPRRRHGAPRERRILRGETPNPIEVPTGCRFHPRCPVAFDRCPQEDPMLGPTRDVDPEHQAACLLLWRMPDDRSPTAFSRTAGREPLRRGPGG